MLLRMLLLHPVFEAGLTFNSPALVKHNIRFARSNSSIQAPYSIDLVLFNLLLFKILFNRPRTINATSAELIGRSAGDWMAVPVLLRMLLLHPVPEGGPSARSVNP